MPVAALHGAGERLQADVVGAAVAAEGDEASLVVGGDLALLLQRPGTRPRRREAVAAAFSKALWMNGTFQAVYG